MLIVTEYHPLGSLYEYLETHTLNKLEALKFLSSSSSGLAHLHGEMRGVACKPSIAHRDLKTKNILVKRDMECCLADFGSSIRDGDIHVSRNENEKFRPVGSVRYMAPEVLASEFDTCRSLCSISDFKRADVYSFGLVIWEVLSRVRIGAFSSCSTDQHRPPFYEIVNVDPSIELMRGIVCERKIRPALSNSLQLESCQVIIFLN